MAKKKFDTNPLDPSFPERVAEAQRAETTQNLDAKTQAFAAAAPTSAPPSVTEDETRRYDNSNFMPPYMPPFDGQNVPQAYHSAKFAEMNSSNSRKVEKIGLPENILTALPYIPFYIGLIAGILVLFFVPKSETKVRFHAAQGLAAHLAILIITTIMGGVGKITDLADFGNAIFQIVTTIMLIVFAIKAWQGKPVHIEAVDELTEWLEEKIQPKH
jgi:uncharacterized membrane protein